MPSILSPFIRRSKYDIPTDDFVIRAQRFGVRRLGAAFPSKAEQFRP
jgi:hypothetical protein